MHVCGDTGMDKLQQLELKANNLALNWKLVHSVISSISVILSFADS